MVDYGKVHELLEKNYDSTGEGTAGVVDLDILRELKMALPPVLTPDYLIGYHAYIRGERQEGLSRLSSKIERVLYENMPGANALSVRARELVRGVFERMGIKKEPAFPEAKDRSSLRAGRMKHG